MKKPFNRQASETYASREDELKAHAAKIDEFLKTPPKPGMFYRPEGGLRDGTHSFAHEALAQKRVDIEKQLETIREDMAKRHAVPTQQKTQAKSLG